MAKKVRTGKKEKKNILSGIVHIQSTFNNTIITITDSAGDVIAWSSSGVQGFKGSRKVHLLLPSWLQRTRLKKQWNME